jgi:hypothetical protein
VQEWRFRAVMVEVEEEVAAVPLTFSSYPALE